MNFFESIFLELGFSWTLAKLTPYALMVLLGFILIYTFHSRIQHKVKKWILISILGVLPFVVYFSIYPIYQGDFSNKHFTPKQLERFPQKLTLSIVVLPGCPYCHETISFMNALISREPKLHIRYVVVSESMAPLSLFSSKLDKRISVIRAKNQKNWIIMAQGGFPCMMISEHSKIIYAWENDFFGVRAIDDYLGRNN